MASLAAGRAAGTFTILDIDHRSYSWTSEREAASVYTEAAGLCDAVVGNEHEFGLLAGGREGALAAATDFVRRGRAFAILKKGVEGSVTITPASVFDTGIVPVAVKKPFGAGDAFMGGLVSALLGGLRIEDAVRRGAASAALVVSRRGCASAMPTADEVDLLLSRHQRTSDAHSPL